MNIDHLTPETAMSLSLTGHYVDEQVAKGKALEDVLAEACKSAGQEIWFKKDALRGFSMVVNQSFVA